MTALQHSIGSYTLESGVTLPDVVVSYVAHGTLAADGGNGVLVTHGYTSGPSMLSPGHHVAESSWAPLLGAGRPLDTSRYFVVCSNMLGSSFGTTGPNTLDPATGKPWGPTFPAITLSDIVGVQKRLLDALGVRHLRAVVGPSYGGSQALQWALQYPERVDAIGVLMSGFTFPPNLSADETRARLAQSPEWQSGNYHAHGGMTATLFATRMQTMLNYGLDRLFADSLPDEVTRRAALEATCRSWAEAFDPYSLVVLAQAAERFDVRARLGEICARLLFVVGTTDEIFPPNEATRELMKQVRTQKRYLELDSPYGHMASGVEWKRLEPELRWLLDDTTASSGS